QKEPPDYDLIATANHQGSVHGGHYTATAKNRVSGNWNLFNDERVHGLEPGEVESASAYVLFYTKASDEECSENAQEQQFHEHLHRPQQPSAFPANEAVAAVSPTNACSVGGRSPRERVSPASSPAGFCKGRRATTGDSKPVSPKRAAAVVRRQSVSKPHNWPHRVDGFEPSFKPAFHPAGVVQLPLSDSVQAMEISVSDEVADVSGGGGGGVPAGGTALTRSMAEQGFGRPYPDGDDGDGRGVVLPTLPGATPALSAGEGESSRRTRGDAEKEHGNLRGGRGGGGTSARRSS
ncbi:unnamed protein product, partial [Hapterophycus canaliculatus]